MVYLVPNDHSSVSHGMSLTRMAADTTGIPIGMHKITINGLNYYLILIKPIWMAEDMTPGSLYFY